MEDDEASGEERRRGRSFSSPSTASRAVTQRSTLGSLHRSTSEHTHTSVWTGEDTHTHANAQKDNMSSYIVKARTSETTGRRAEQQKADLDLIQSTVITADYTRTASGHAHVTSGTPSRRQAATKFSTLSRHFARLSLGCEQNTHTHMHTSYSPSQQEAAAVLLHSLCCFTFNIFWKLLMWNLRRK